MASDLKLIDNDVHPHLPNGLTDLGPYMQVPWRKRLRLDQKLASWAKDLPASQYTLPKNDMYLPTPGAMRRDASASPGSIPASDPKFVAHHLLDQHKIDRAVLIGGNILGLSSLPDPEMAAAIAPAYNDWLADTWLSADARYRQAAVVPAQNPVAAAAEVRRIADQPGVVGIMLPLANVLMGEAQFHPIYDAAQEADLPILVHLAGTESIFAKGAQFPGGPPTYYIEWHVGVTTIYQANIVSLVAHGVFERFPKLKVVVVEGGITWLLETMWRFDKDWRGLRDEVPWVKRPPSEYIREHVHLTTQPVPEPTKSDDLLRFIEMTQSDRMLLFSSDYPHWDFDNPMVSLKGLPAETRRRIELDNAIDLYGDRLTASLAPERARAAET